MKMKNWIKVFLVGTMTLGFSQLKAQDAPDAGAQYTKTITDRSNKIVAALGITDSANYKRVLGNVVDQYRNINDIHNEHDAKVADIKKQAGDDKAAAAAKVKEQDADMAAKISALHTQYLAKLNADLTAEQVDKVKDLMTYNIVSFTYQGYLNEVPTLTDVQKAQIKAWLIEAREQSMDGESSKKKHDVFTKYKGRINNYLSAQGYDMKKEAEERQKRTEAGAATKSN